MLWLSGMCLNDGSLLPLIGTKSLPLVFAGSMAEMGILTVEVMRHGLSFRVAYTNLLWLIWKRKETYLTDAGFCLTVSYITACRAMS